MAKKGKVVPVPHGKQGLNLEAVVHNLDALSALVGAFLAAIVKKNPDLKDEMIAILNEMLLAEGFSPTNRESIATALGMVKDLITKDEFAH
jgi:hypothetical protein